ncbi:MAG: heterodisulfide reductase-related iron-sulfur binding cluster [Candidatus Methylomirabilia bacterium]
MNYAEYFGAITVLADLFTEGEPPWVHRLPRSEQRAPIILYLGCNVLRTTHLALTVIDVFRAMGVDFVPMGGPQACCGAVYFMAGDDEAATKLGERTVRNFRAFQPEKIVMWCPSCVSIFDRRLSKVMEIDVPWEHATQFIAENLHRLPPLRPIERSLALHRHGGTPQQERDAACARRILEAIPGLEVLDLPYAPELGEHCTPFLRQAIGEDRFQEAIGSLFRRARESGATAVATIYHSCHREICEQEGHFEVEVSNYISLLGKALGISHEDRFKRFKLCGDADAMMEELRPVIQRKALDERRVRQVLSAHFAKPESPLSRA